MDKATVTLALDGRPTLGDYVLALAKFKDLVDLSSGDSDITWEIDGLEMGSTVTTAVGITDDAEALRRVTSGLIEVGRQLRDQGSVSNPLYGPAAQGLIGILNGRVPSIRIETEQDEVTIASVGAAVSAPPSSGEIVEFGPTLGAVEGRIQTLSNRGSLRFTLYDLLFDKAVSCYLQPGQEDMMRDAWGRVAIVEGLVRRDPVSGRPTIIRQVSNIDLREEGRPGAWRTAAGVLHLIGEDEPSEVTIRRLRDA